MLLLPLRLLVALVANLLLVPRNLVRALSRRPRWVRLRLEGPVAERPHKRRWPFGTSRKLTVADLADLGERMKSDKILVGVILEIDAVECGWARLESLHAAVAAWRAAGKRVVAHLSSPGTREYFLASACDEVFVDESGPVALVGLAAVAGFYGEALRRFGVDPELERVGAYKSYAETFTRADMSPAHREATEAVLDGVERVLVDAVARGRKVDEGRARAIVRGGPYLAHVAVDEEIVDAVLYRDELAARLGTTDARIVTREAYLAARPSWWVPTLLRRRAVAVLSLEGTIVPGEGVGLVGRACGAEAACRALDSLRERRRVAAVVLHVDSRGGSAAASDRIWRAAERLAGKKPVVACLGDVAASGGYYIVAPCASIVARATTLTGSIGVVAGKFAVERLLDKLGIGTTVLRRGDAAAMLSPRRRFDDEERRRLAIELDGTYRQFVARVAAGRKRPVEDVEPSARGRVWTGADAVTQKLVDKLGGIGDAIDDAKARARRRPSEKLVVVDVAPRPRREGGGLLAGLAGLAREHVLLVGGDLRIE